MLASSPSSQNNSFHYTLPVVCGQNYRRSQSSVSWRKGDHGAQYWNCRKWMSVIFNGWRHEPLSDFTSWWHRIHITHTVQTLTKATQTVKRETCSSFEGKWRRIWPEGEGRLGNEQGRGEGEETVVRILLWEE